MSDRLAEMTFALDIGCITALEQMATAENRSISDVLQSSIAARWKNFCETERRRREAALRGDRNRMIYAIPGGVTISQPDGHSGS
ncbi:MAG: hypothetical protein OXF88_01435 [Rhodobacteraceae bacterium]|nr:hypothetical protein [Paracoccaceae bacterium]MCY4141068.1 hypothetical protein [Paracoccaceae bacterium]